MASAVLAGPGGPWYLSDEAGNPVDIPANCDHPSPDGLDGWWYTNAKSEKTHCFKA